ncbi:MAG: hypothetical protein HOJ88_11635 [Proteobacteria bacterium]|jgi:hypothetical protein|nr:hypothetical protein [Pseudomonadota bacterium]
MRTLSRVLRVSATALMLVPLIASSQEHLSEGWAEVKQEMIKLGMRYDSAWELYQAFETEAEGKTLEPNDLPDWSGLWTRDGGPSKFDNDRVGTASTASLKGEYLQMMQQQIDEAAQGRVWDPHSGCGQARGYPGMLKNGRPHEFAVTPHQTWHLGQARNEVRRIYTDGRGHVPEDWAYDTEHGDTIGFWDGDRLVTHTMNTNGGWIGRLQPYFSNQLQGTEVWQKVDETTIQADVWIYDPEALEEPWYTRQVYTRMHEEPGQPLRLEYWWNCHSPNNIVVPTEDGGTTFLDLDFTDMDDAPAKENTQ